MGYSSLIEDYRKSFAQADLLKEVKDIVCLLDAPATQVSPDASRFSAEAGVKARQLAYLTLKKICDQSEVPHPSPEPLFWEFYLQSSDSKRTREDAEEMMGRLKQRAAAVSQKQKEVISKVEWIFEMFPALAAGTKRLNREQLLAVVNKQLAQADEEPIFMPDDDIPELQGSGKWKPEEELCVLIVDDEVESLIKTGLALAGWPNLQINLFRYTNPNNLRSYADEAEFVEERERVGGEILEKNPDVVLMDEGMPPIEGHNVIRAIHKITENPPLFVGNSGGDPKQLREAGALTNCNKGKYLQGVTTAIRQTGRG